MSLLPNSISRATHVEQFYDEPFGFLERSRNSLGNIFVIRDNGPIFSRAADCAGTIAVFGAAHHRAVLGDIDSFGLPISAAEHLSLPRKLVNLNRGLHSMRGAQHTQQQRAIMRVLNERNIEEQHARMSSDLETFVQGWRSGKRIHLLAEMRQLALQVSAGLLFGDRCTDKTGLASLLLEYFHVRREATSAFSPAVEVPREELATLGASVDEALRKHIRWRRRQKASSDGLLAKLAGLELEPGKRFSEDGLVAHSNVLFMSSNEPIAVSLTWILLILSQLPDLRRALRQEIEPDTRHDAVPEMSGLAKLTLLDAVINESLRLLGPNALMSRVTTRPVSLQNVLLPERCEVVLCPFLAHRDADCFPQPKEFRPSRWIGTRLSPFEYFPFGAGGHSCVGHQLAIYLIKAALALLIPRFEIVLAEDQEIDWRVHILLMPRNDPLMSIRSATSSNSRAGKLLGPVSDLIAFDSYLSALTQINDKDKS